MKAMMTAMMTAAIKRCLFIFLPSACRWGLGLSTGLSGVPRWSGIWEKGDSARRGQGGRWRTLAASPRASKGRGSCSWGGRGAWAPAWGSPRAAPHSRGASLPRGVCVAKALGLCVPPTPGGPDMQRCVGEGTHFRLCRNAQLSTPRAPPLDPECWAEAPPPGGRSSPSPPAGMLRHQPQCRRGRMSDPGTGWPGCAG